MQRSLPPSAIMLLSSLLVACGKSPSYSSAPPPPTQAASSAPSASFMRLIERDPPSESDIAEFLALASGADAPSAMRVFTIPESDFTERKVADADNQAQNYIDLSADLRRFSRAVIDRGNALRDSGDIEDARRHYQAVLTAADANSWEGVAQVGKMTADAMRRAAEAELAKLPAP